MRPISALLLLCLLASSAFAADPDPLAAGRAAIEKREFEKAASLLEKAIAANPKNVEAHYLLGTVYGAQAQSAGMLKQASLAKKVKAEFEAAVALDPNHINARQGLVDYYTIAPGFMGGSIEKALAQAAEIKKRDALKGHHAYARIYAREKKIDLARKELVTAVREQPNNPRAHQALGMFLLNTDKNHTGALHEFEMALKLDPAYMPAHLRIGQVAAVSGTDFARGEAFIKKYLAYKPTDEEPPVALAWYWLGMLYEKQGRKADAKQSFTNALKLVPEDKNIKEALKRVS
ncbi:MAG TPA: tetratricopeptide repeat protein [Thermoanaerobaculia bacterium]|nr:tetratricopeptide repeat protein [Thermoanaerobaculia bacterium]